MNLEIVKWVDSRQSDGSWRFVEDVPEPCIVCCQTVGWIVGESDEVLMVAQSVGDSGLDSMQCAGIKQIPKCSISNRKMLIT